MFVSIEAFLQEWEMESAGTLRLLKELTDASLDQEVAPGFRTLGRLAWHIATSPHEMLSRTGLSFESPGEDEDYIPSSAKEIVSTYEAASAGLAHAIRTQWTDADLERKSDMYGEPWANGLTLSVLIKHEIHHRGQLTVLMRQAGLGLHGLYGPSKNEWSAFGMQPPVV